MLQLAASLRRSRIHPVSLPTDFIRLSQSFPLQDQAPQYKTGHSIVLGFVAAAWVFVALNVYVEIS